MSDYTYLYICVAVAVLAVTYVYLNARFKRSRFLTILNIAEKAVQAVEQQYRAKTGEEKKAIAFAMIQEILLELGYKDIPVELIDMAIETAVFAINKVRKQVEQVKKACDETTPLPGIIINS
ncbi:MAG: phage holin [Bacillota bacterium]